MRLQPADASEFPADVAVVIAAFNAASTLGATLASVAAQSLQPGAVVIVDDGSSDTTGQVAESWKDRIPLTVIRHEVNLGLAAARRSGITGSIEPLIAILDADDIWLPDHLSLMRRTYQDYGGLITADALRWMPARGLSRLRYREIRPIPPRAAQRTAILLNNFVFIGSMFSREAYTLTGGFRDGLLGAEDWDLWIRLIRAGVPVTGTPYPTVLYRTHRGALSHGAQQLENEALVLETVIGEVSASGDRSTAERGLRAIRARLRLARAYDCARSGHTGDARRQAARALRGPMPVALRAASMIIAPGPSVRIRDRMSWQPFVRLGR